MKNPLFILCVLFSLTIKAQDKAKNVEDNKLLSTTEFSIPSSPAFDLLGYNPAQVTKPSTIKEVKVDWSLRTWGGKPNIAVEVQPIWELFYNKADLRYYQRANKVMRMLSTLDISAGTVDEPDKDKAKIGLQRGAIAAKLNLYRAKDPLHDAKLYEGIDTSYRRIQLERMELINEATFFYKRAKNDSLRYHFESRKDSLEGEYDKAAMVQKEAIQKISQKYMKDNWNASHLDIAYGKVFNYEYRGNWRINRNIMLSFGVRTDYREDFRFKNLMPTASIVCMMR